MAQYTTAQRDALREAIALGALRVKYRDREVTYRDLDEMRRLLREIEADIAKDQGLQPRRRARQVRFVTGGDGC